MNILFVADVSIQNKLGGAERVLYEQSVRLAQKGHQVYILTRQLTSHDAGYAVINGIHEHRYEVNTNNPVAFLLSTVLNGQKLYRQISRKIKFGAINFHQPFGAFAVNLLDETHNIRKFYTCHSLSFEEYISRNPKERSVWFTLNVFLRKFIEKFSLDRCGKIIVLSQFTKDRLGSTHKIPTDKILILPGGVDTERFKPTLDKEILRQELKVPDNTLFLFTARNLVPRMGLENLVKIVPLLQEKGLAVHLAIGGQGALKEKLQALIEGLALELSVTLCGFMSDKDLVQYYQAADFFILPTVELEGFGLITLESMACGTPVLATPVGGTVEILSRFDRDLLFTNISPEAMAELIFEKYTYYKNKPAEYKQLCAKARAFVEKNYSWEDNVHDLEKILCAEYAEK